LPGTAGATGATGSAGSSGATGATGIGLPGAPGSDAIPSLQNAPLFFNAKNEASVTTVSVSGKTYLISFTVQTRAANIKDASKLALNTALSSTISSTKFTQIVVVPSTGLNSRGQVVQTLQVSGLYLPGSDNEKIKVVLTEANAKKVTSIVGNMTLTLVNYTQLERDRILLNEELEAAIAKVDEASVRFEAAKATLLKAKKTATAAQSAYAKVKSTKNRTALSKAQAQVKLSTTRVYTAKAELDQALAAKEAISLRLNNS
jgi:hypothetical protein